LGEGRSHAAKEWAENFPSAFGLEKAAALKEAAGAVKKADPARALDLLGKGLDQALTLPEGPKTSGFYPSWWPRPHCWIAQDTFPQAAFYVPTGK